MKKENKFSLHSTLAFQTRNLMLGFVAICAAMLGAGTVIESVNDIKLAKEAHNGALSKQDKKHLAKGVSKNALLLVVSLAVIYVMCATLKRAKQYNNDAAVRVARRYIAQTIKENPELKNYVGILHNDMALHNIAAGIANKLSVEELMVAGSAWDAYRFDAERVKSPVANLKLKNVHIQNVIDMLDEHAQKDPQFMPYLAKLVEDSTRTFSLDQYMAQQKVR